MTNPFEFESCVADKVFFRVCALCVFKTVIYQNKSVNETNFPVNNHDKIIIKDDSFI